MASARRQTYGTVDDELRIALDEFEHACIAESVAPALEYIDEMVKLGHVSLSDSRKLRSLLTEGRE